MMRYNSCRQPAQKNYSSGFTLIEMLVTVAVFAIVMAVSSSIFINVTNLQQQTANMAKLQNEGRYLLEKMGKEIRGRELDYDAIKANLDPATGLTDILIFKKDEFGDVYKISFDPAVQSISDPAGQSIIIEIDNDVTGVKSAALSSESVIVDKMSFQVSPVTDPYDIFTANPPMFQPRVTIAMVIKNRNVPDKYRKTLTLQTTISSKIYR